ncbi:MAG: hypothetical protein UY72_C0002G0004 [Candidatus Uhrbacteria bacterium GW2011_GWD2_52_7]|uniref:Uncharacterized protein n=1 Tax=Candidatus Uhrbacteria bacterium GW2011_GWD2_52_7 TaxID=1618989 RepID=A0A0G2AED6_9BACT|nr:MAG: hypothetical protein UY72_C0002G0004 [Candidatus Uhrbacteria bacterium GW2011_GWD2_52_7]
MRFYGIVLLLDKESSIEAAVVNRRLHDISSDPPIQLRFNERMCVLADEESLMRVFDEDVGDVVGSWPHISLVHKALGDTTDVLRLVRAIREAVVPLKMRRIVGGFTSYQPRGRYIFRMSSMSKPLINLHLAVAHAASSIDGDCRMPLPDDLEGLDVMEWERYGWLHAGANYRYPHITIGHVPEEHVPLAMSRMPGAKRDPALRDMHSGDIWSSSRIGIGPLGPHGTLERLIASISL